MRRLYLPHKAVPHIVIGRMLEANLATAGALNVLLVVRADLGYLESGPLPLGNFSRTSRSIGIVAIRAQVQVILDRERQPVVVLGSAHARSVDTLETCWSSSLPPPSSRATWRSCTSTSSVTSSRVRPVQGPRFRSGSPPPSSC